MLCSILTVLRMNKGLWMSMELEYICGFRATRDFTDQMLSNQAEGTFLIRPSMAMEATLVISVATRTKVLHLAINYQQLMDRSLEVRASLNPIPKQCLESSRLSFLAGSICCHAVQPASLYMAVATRPHMLLGRAPCWLSLHDTVVKKVWKQCELKR